MRFEVLLGKSIAFAESSIGDEFTSELFRANFYYLDKDSGYRLFYGSKYNCLSFQKNKVKAVHSVTVYLLEVLNIKTFDLLKEEYGEPDHIWVVEKTILISESFDDSKDFQQYLIKREHDLREGAFDEKPLFIIWNKGVFEIKLFFRYEQNVSQVSFSQIS